MSDDARQDAVRRLLAESRHDEPLPPDVAARLDTLLGELTEARAAQSRVPDLAQRRRQRRGLFLAAAAAAVVVGVAGVALPQLGGSQDAGSASDSAATRADPEAAADGGSEAGAVGPGAAAAPQVRDAPEFADGDVLVVDARTFDDDAAGLVDPARAPAYRSELSLTGVSCGPAAYGEGELLPALYDGAPAVLAVRPVVGGTRVVEVVACGTGEVLRSATASAS